jgi:hypothetical protein
MTRLTALQLLDLNNLSKEDSGDDSGDDSEYDNVEIIIRNEDGEVEEEEAEEREEYDESACKKAWLQVPEDLLTPEIEVNSNNAFNVLDKNKIFYGGINKKNPKPFEWYSNPVNQVRQKRLFRHTRIIPNLKDEKSIEIFFQQIITISIVDKIAKYSNKKIKLIDNQVIENAKYRLAREKLTSLEVSSEELYGFIGILILSNETIESLWNEASLHYASFAAVTMSRDRFQLISRNITFDDLDTRNIRKTLKFHKMQEIFEDFKSNLELIIPSNSLCVDEELYAFRGLKYLFIKQISSKI